MKKCLASSRSIISSRSLREYTVRVFSRGFIASRWCVLVMAILRARMDTSQRHVRKLKIQLEIKYYIIMIITSIMYMLKVQYPIQFNGPFRNIGSHYSRHAIYHMSSLSMWILRDSPVTLKRMVQNYCNILISD